MPLQVWKGKMSIQVSPTRGGTVDAVALDPLALFGEGEKKREK